MAPSATPTSSIPENSYNVSAVEVKFIDANGDPVGIDERPANLSLTLAAIPGSLSGKPGPTLAVVPLGRMSSVQIDLGSFGEAIAKEAGPMNEAAGKGGLQIEPSDTRFARASTLVQGAFSGQLWVGLAERDSRKLVALAYFSRPCRVFGKRTVASANGERQTTNYDIRIEKPGRNWIVQTSEVPNESLLRAETSPADKVLFVVPIENLRSGVPHIK